MLFSLQRHPCRSSCRYRPGTAGMWRVRLALYPVVNPLLAAGGAVPAISPCADNLLQVVDGWLIGENLSVRLGLDSSAP
jgi:hypothetical protein